MAVSRSLRLLIAVGLATSGAVALTASAASAATVANESDLRDAFADGAETTIELTADIALTDCAAGDLDRPAGAAPLTLSGAFTITQTCANERVIGSADSAVGALTVNDLTITGGALTDAVSAVGGGISWFGDVTLNRATVTGNTATAPFGGLGGGVFTNGALTINQSTISENGALSNGDFGGLAGGFNAGGNTVVTDSLIAANTAGGGAEFGGTGGAAFGNSDFTFVRSTLTGNQATGSTDDASGGNGGGVVTNGELAVIDSTVTGNSATGTTGNNGGIAAGGDTTIAYSTIVGNSAATAANVQGLSDDPAFSIDAVFASVISDPLGGGTNCGPASDAVSQGYNYSDDDSCNLTATGDRQSAGDPLLGALGDNGGPTPTMLPAAMSPLLDVIPPAACQSGIGAGIDTDQRGVTRPQGTGCDIGAVEVEVIVPTNPTNPVVTPVVVTPRFTG